MPRRKQNYPKRLKCSRCKTNNSEQSSDSGGDNSDTLTSGDEADDEGGLNDDEADTPLDVTSNNIDILDTETKKTSLDSSEETGNVENMTVSRVNSPHSTENTNTEKQKEESVKDENKSPKPSVIDHMESVVSADETTEQKAQTMPHINSPPLASLKLPLINYFISSSDQPLDLSKKSTKPARRHRTSKGLSNGHSGYPSSLQSLQLRFGGDFPIDMPKIPSSSIPLQSSIIQGKTFLRPPVPPTGNHIHSSDFNHKPRVSSSKNEKTDIQSISPFQKAELSDSDDIGNEHPGSKYTIHHCSCQKTFSTLYAMSVHLQDTGHMPKVTKSQSVIDYPKLVRGQDMWLNQESEQTRRILRCMQCGESFKSLPMLTVHMMQTQHYTKIVSSDHGRRSHKCSAYCEKELDRECIFKCKVCHDTFTDMEGLANHMIMSGHHKKQVLQTGSYPTEYGMRSRRKRYYSEEGSVGAATVASLLDYKRKCLSYGPNGFRGNSTDMTVGKIDNLITCENCGQKIEMEMFVDHVRLCLKQKSEVIDALKRKLTTDDHSRIRHDGSYHQIARVKQEFKVTSRNRHHMSSSHNDPKRGLQSSLSPREQARKDAIRALKKLHRIKKEHLLNGKDVYEIMETMYKKTFDDINKEKLQTRDITGQKDRTVLPQQVKATRMNNTSSRQTVLFSPREVSEKASTKDSPANKSLSKQKENLIVKKEVVSSPEIDKMDSMLKEALELPKVEKSIDKTLVKGNNICDIVKTRQNIETLVSPLNSMPTSSPSDTVQEQVLSDNQSSMDENSPPSHVSLATTNETSLIMMDTLINHSVKEEITEEPSNSLVKTQGMSCDSKCDNSLVTGASGDEQLKDDTLTTVDCVTIKTEREASSPDSNDGSDLIAKKSGGSEQTDTTAQRIDDADSDGPVLECSGNLDDCDFNDNLKSSDSQLTAKPHSADNMKTSDSQLTAKQDSADNINTNDSQLTAKRHSDAESSDSQSAGKRCSTDNLENNDFQPVTKKCSADNLKSSCLQSIEKKGTIDKTENIDFQAISQKCSSDVESSDSQSVSKTCSSCDDVKTPECLFSDVSKSDSKSNSTHPQCDNVKANQTKLKDMFDKTVDATDKSVSGKTETNSFYKSNLSISDSDAIEVHRKSSLAVSRKTISTTGYGGDRDKFCNKLNILDPDHKDTDVPGSKDDDVSRQPMDIIDPDSTETTDSSNSALKAMESFIERSFTSTFDNHRTNIVSMLSPVSKLCVPLQSSATSADNSLHYFGKFRKCFSFDPNPDEGKKVLENGALSLNEKSIKVKESVKVKGSSHRLPASTKHETKESEDQDSRWSPVSLKSEKDSPSPLPGTEDDQESLVNKYLCVEGQNSTNKGSALDSLSSFVYGQPMTSEHPLDSLQKLLTRTEIPQMLKANSESVLRMCSSPEGISRPLNLSMKSSNYDDDGNEEMDGLEETGSVGDGAGSPSGCDGELSEYKCAACSRQFASKGSYRYHLSRCHLSSVKMYGIKEAFNMSPYVYLPLDHTAKFSKYYEMAHELANKGK